MAVGTAYATAAEYRAGVDQDDTSEDGEILLYTTGISHIIEKRCRRFFNKTAAAAQPLNGNGARRLWVPDISTLTGLVVKLDSTGDFSYDKTLTIVTDFFVGPWNRLTSALTPEELPGMFLDLNPNSTQATVWPERDQAVQVTAAWGWPAVPEAIKRGCIALTKAVRDASKQPFTLTLESLESQIAMSPGASKILDELVWQYGRREDVIG